MNDRDRAALYRRVAATGRNLSGTLRHAAAEQIRADATALEALAAECEANPWLDAPDVSGDWQGHKPGYVAHDLVVTSVFDRLYVRSAEHPESEDAPLYSWLAAHPGWRYSRRVPVVVPPRETEGGAP